MRRDSERRPSWTTEAAEDHIGDAITRSLPPHPDAAPDAHQLVAAVRVLLAAAVAAVLVATLLALLIGGGR